jgi:hypothetical protein
MASSIVTDHTLSSSLSAVQECNRKRNSDQLDSTTTVLPKRHVGRAARQRRRKWKEIRLLEDSIRSGTVVIPVVLPVDRDLVLPKVLQLRAMCEWDHRADGMALQSQLGYIPGNAIRVVARVKDAAQVLCSGNDGVAAQDVNDPVIVQLYPLVGRDAPSSTSKQPRKRSLESSAKETTVTNPLKPLLQQQQQPILEPFPTLYWLTHPLLRCLVSKLELEGFGIELEQRLQQDANAMSMMRKAHTDYGEERWSLLSSLDQEMVRHQRWEGALAPHRGVAGIRNCGAVKCLHAHLAHYLSQGSSSTHNRVGQWVWEELVARNNA